MWLLAADFKAVLLNWLKMSSGNAKEPTYPSNRRNQLERQGYRLSFRPLAKFDFAHHSPLFLSERGTDMVDQFRVFCLGVS